MYAKLNFRKEVTQFARKSQDFLCRGDGGVWWDWGVGGGGSMDQVEGDFGGLLTPLVVVWAGFMCSTLLLLPAPQKWQLGFGFFVSYCV